MTSKKALAWTVALFLLTDIAESAESYSISCSDFCKENEYKTGCYNKFGFGKGKSAFFHDETGPIRAEANEI